MYTLVLMQKLSAKPVDVVHNPAFVHWLCYFSPKVTSDKNVEQIAAKKSQIVQAERTKYTQLEKSNCALIIMMKLA